MSKKILQDIIRSNRPTHVSNTRNDRTKKERHISIKKIRKTKEKAIKKVKSPKLLMWFLAFASVVFLIFILLSLFSGTVIDVVPAQKQISLNSKVLYAKRDASDKDLGFKMIVLKNSTSMKVPATEEKELDQKASGSITIYNAYSSKSQKLVGKTRFETPDGKIYRIKEPIVVPGMTVQDGKMIPGSVDAVAFADVVGKKYDIGLVDFTIPGFKGNQRFSKFYARSKTSMTGGFSGIVKFASIKDMKNAVGSLDNSLREILLTQARSQVPDNFILYDDAVFFEFSSSTPQKIIAGDSVSITQIGKLYGIILDKDELSNYIVRSFVKKYVGGSVVVNNLNKIKFSVIDKKDFNPDKSNELKFNLLGSADTVWDINKKSLAGSIAGKNKKDFNSIISKYSNIDKAEATLRPFWLEVFPKNIKDITINILNNNKLAI